MNIDEFLRELANTPRGWHVLELGGAILLNEGPDPDEGRIPMVYNPLTAVAILIRKIGYYKHFNNEGFWLTAGKFLGLSQEDILRIEYSSGHPYSDSSYFDANLRQRILKAVGL